MQSKELPHLEGLLMHLVGWQSEELITKHCSLQSRLVDTQRTAIIELVYRRVHTITCPLHSDIMLETGHFHPLPERNEPYRIPEPSLSISEYP